MALTAVAGVPFAIAALVSSTEQSRTAKQQLDAQLRVYEQQMLMLAKDEQTRARMARLQKPDVRYLGGSLGASDYVDIKHYSGTEPARRIEVWGRWGELWVHGQRPDLTAQEVGRVSLTVVGTDGPKLPSTVPAHPGRYIVVTWYDEDGQPDGFSQDLPDGEPHPLASDK